MRILPRNGSTAWYSRLRPCLAVPPAESPSTMKISDLAGSRSWQSASLPGRLATSSAPLRRVSSRALRAASRACAASTTLPTIDPRLGRMLLEPLLEELVDQPLDHRPDLRGHQLVLGLRGEFRVGALDAEDAGQALAAVVAGKVDLLLLHQSRAFGVADDLPGQRATEADQVRAAVALGDVVGERQHVLVVAIVPPQRDLDPDAVALALDQDRFFDQRRLGAVEIAHERFEAALVVKVLALGFGLPCVRQHDVHAGIEEGEFAQPMLDGGDSRTRPW